MAPHVDERPHRHPEDRQEARTDTCRLFVHLGIIGAGSAVFSATATAHEVGHGGGQENAAVAFAVVLGLPILGEVVRDMEYPC